jgi:hypothetical protein
MDLVFRVAARYLLSRKGFSLVELRGKHGGEIHEYLSQFKVIGEGRTRVTYQVTSSKVVKVASNKAGFQGNQIEVSASGSRFAPIAWDYDPEFEWVLSEKVLPVNDSMVDTIFRSRTGLGQWELAGVLWVGVRGKVPSHSKPVGKIGPLKVKHEDLLKTNAWYREFLEFLINFKIDPFELHSVNLGLSKGNLVVLDLGPSFGTR